jgi:hypothetical protein
MFLGIPIWRTISPETYQRRMRLLVHRPYSGYHREGLRMHRFELDALRFSDLHSWYKHLKHFRGSKFFILLRSGVQEAGNHYKDNDKTMTDTSDHLHFVSI